MISVNKAITINLLEFKINLFSNKKVGYLTTISRLKSEKKIQKIKLQTNGF